MKIRHARLTPATASSNGNPRSTWYGKGLAPEQCTAAQALLQRLMDLRARCRRYTGSFVTPMGDEMDNRYQQSLIDESINTLGALLRRAAAKP